MIGPVIFVIVMLILAVTFFILSVIKDCNFTYALSVEEIDIIKKHNYTEKEYTTLFDYCAKKHRIYCDCSNRTIYIDRFLDTIREDSTNPYIKPDYDDLCSRLLTLLPDDERKKINFGILIE